MRLTPIILLGGLLFSGPAWAGSYAEPYWENADLLTKRFICSSYGEVPAWCEALQMNAEGQSIAGALTARQSSAAEEAAKAAAAARQMADRQAIVRRIRAGRFAGKDVNALMAQAKKGEASAMELLAWMYAQGFSPKAGGSLELAELAYIWYGRAYLAGATEVKANMDAIWPTLSETQQRRIVALFDGKQAP